MTETYHQVGGVHTTTMGYNSADLSSIACINSLGSGDGSPVKWAPINYADLYAPIPASESSSRVARCFTDPSQAAEWGDYMQNPFISLPEDISNADPLWSTCSAAILGAMDPPSALTAGVAMVPVSVGQDAAKPEKATTTAADPVQTAVPGQPIPVPAPSPTAPNGGDDPTKPGSIDLGNDQDSPSTLGHTGGAQPDSMGFLTLASELVNPNSTPTKVAPGPVAASNPSNLQFGSGPENTDPNDMSPTELSILYQALTPSPNPIIANSATSPNAGQASGNAPGNPQAEPEAATVASIKSPDVQLQPISAAIFNNQQPSRPVPITVAGLAMQSASNGGVIMAGQTLAPGVQTAIGGHAISVGSGNVVVDGNTQILPTAISAPPPQPLIGGSTMQRAANGAVIIGGSNLPIGSQATIAGHVISVGSANVVVDGTTNALPTPAPTASPIRRNDQTFQRAANGALIIGTSTVALGSQTTIEGHLISVGSNNVVLDSSSYALPAVAGATLISSPNASVQRNAITLPNGSILSAGGSPVTISSETISILSNDQGAVIDGSTILFASPTAQSVFTVGGQTFSAAPSSFVVGGATVSLDGAAVTIAGTVVSLGPSGLQVGSMTIPLATAAPTGLGGYIISAFNAPTTAANSTGSVSGGPSATGAEAYTGSGARLKRDIWLTGLTVFMCMGIGMVAVLM